MVVVADASVAIRGDMSGFNNDLKGAQRETMTLGQKLNDLLSPKNLLKSGLAFGLGTSIPGMIRDVIGFTGDANTWVTLELTLRAYLLMREEFPLSLPYLTKEEDAYLFHGPVASFEGVGRFSLGLIDEVRVKSPESFIAFLKSKLMLQKL